MYMHVIYMLVSYFSLYKMFEHYKRVEYVYYQQRRMRIRKPKRIIKNRNKKRKKKENIQSRLVLPTGTKGLAHVARPGGLFTETFSPRRETGSKGGVLQSRIRAPSWKTGTEGVFQPEVQLVSVLVRKSSPQCISENVRYITKNVTIVNINDNLD